MQNCSNFSALAMELLKSCKKPSIYQLIVSQWHYMEAWILINIVSGNGFLPESTGLLPDWMLTCCQLNLKEYISLVFVWGIHRGPVNSMHKWPVTWKMFPFDDVIMCLGSAFMAWICDVSLATSLIKPIDGKQEKLPLSLGKNTVVTLPKLSEHSNISLSLTIILNDMIQSVKKIWNNWKVKKLGRKKAITWANVDNFLHHQATVS